MSTHAMFLSHNGMTEALGQTQVLPYVRGIGAAGVHIDLFACEPPGTRSAEAAKIAAALQPWNIRYSALRRRPTTSLLDKVRDAGDLLGAALLQAARAGRRPDIVHARSQLPAAVAAALRAALPGARLIFDCRGLLAEEYVDMGHWRAGEVRHALTTQMEARLFSRADRVVVLTTALADELCGAGGPCAGRAEAVVVIPCCVDTDRFRPDPQARARHRAELGVADDEMLLCFAGSTARYDLEVAARLLAALRRRTRARFLLLSRAPAEPVRAIFARQGLADALLIVGAPPAAVPGWLCAADMAIACLRDSRSSIATSPTKIAEGLATGLPTVVSAGIADSSRLLGPGLLPVVPQDSGAVVEVAEALLQLLSNPEEARAGARDTALRHFSLSEVGLRRYQALYRALS